MDATVRIKWLGAALAALPYPFLALSGGQDAPRALYARDVAPVLKAHCVSCHNAERAAGGLRLDLPEAVAKAAKSGVLMARVHGNGGKPQMPLGFPALPAEKIQVLDNWVAQGARIAPPKALFATDVLPVLKAKCGTCHSGASPRGGLDLTDGKQILHAVAKGDPIASSLVRRLQGLDGKPQMPMGFAPLPAETIQKIKDWIAEGAYLDGGEKPHWAYIAPIKPVLPQVKNVAWIRNPIDRFVLAKLEKEGLKPSPVADRETLIRRLSLDLTGLPPTPQQTDAFLADQRPGAYERLVDRLLASPQFGEVMAQRWLDLARYADSDGFEKDRNRVAWVYRDWVIAAFNRNLPYDKFVVEQLAGDELPSPTLQQMVATGFNRNTMMNREGGTDPEEQNFNVILDRVATTSTVFMGSTLACARCHDHKYDPFTQRGFYKMAAFFSNDQVIPRGDASVSELYWEEPELKVPTSEQSDAIAKLRAQIAALPKDVAPAAAPRWELLHPTEMKADVATLQVQPDGSIDPTGTNPAQDSYRLTVPLPHGPVTGLRLESFGGRSQNRNFVLTEFEVRADGKPVPLAGASADFSQDGYDPAALVDGDRSSGWAIHPQETTSHDLVVSFATPIPAQKIEVVLGSHSPYAEHNLGRFRLTATTDVEPHAQHGKSATAIRRTVLNRRIQATENAMPMALILREKPGNATPKAWVRQHGEFLTKSEEVVAAPPAFLPALAQGVRPSRLALAQWLVDKRNPLTARVEANRLWEWMFGTGLVETSEDFGTQGTPPTHPELLDWLAVRLRDGGWNVKDAVRLIVTSATYRQSSATTPALLKRDPENRLLARAPRYRLEAETIRDNALAVSGLLDRHLGGPSVMPDQPAGVWDTPYNGQQWMPSTGGDRFRRGLYTFWKRSAPYPAFVAFDATSRETCTVRRIRTNTPLQALALLNDTSMMAAAQALAGRMMREGGKDPLGYGFRLATGRRPGAAERARLAKLQTTLLARYRAKPAEAAKLGGPEKAARALTANVLLNLDETITKE